MTRNTQIWRPVQFRNLKSFTQAQISSSIIAYPISSISSTSPFSMDQVNPFFSQSPQLVSFLITSVSVSEWLIPIRNHPCMTAHWAKRRLNCFSTRQSFTSLWPPGFSPISKYSAMSFLRSRTIIFTLSTSTSSQIWWTTLLQRLLLSSCSVLESSAW